MTMSAVLKSGVLTALFGLGILLGAGAARAQTPPLTLPKEVDIPGYDNHLEAYTDYWGILVMDAPNTAAELAQSFIIKDSNQRLFWEIVGLYVQLRYLQDPAFRDLTARRQFMEAIARAAGAFGYSRSDLVAMLEEAFPGLTDTAEDLFARTRERLGRTLRTAKNNVAVLRQHYLQIQEDLQLLRKYREQLTSDIPWLDQIVYPTAKAYGVMNEAALFALQEIRLMEQLGAMNLNTSTLKGLHALQQRAARRNALRDALGLDP